MFMLPQISKTCRQNVDVVGNFIRKPVIVFISLYLYHRALLYFVLRRILGFTTSRMARIVLRWQLVLSPRRSGLIPGR